MSRAFLIPISTCTIPEDAVTIQTDWCQPSSENSKGFYGLEDECISVQYNSCASTSDLDFLEYTAKKKKVPYVSGGRNQKGARTEAAFFVDARPISEDSRHVDPRCWNWTTFTLSPDAAACTGGAIRVSASAPIMAGLDVRHHPNDVCAVAGSIPASIRIRMGPRRSPVPGLRGTGCDEHASHFPEIFRQGMAARAPSLGIGTTSRVLGGLGLPATDLGDR